MIMKGKNYEITKKNLKFHELIGLKVSVTKGSTERIGLKGTIVDETKQTFVIETKNGEKIVPKIESIFEFDIKGKVILSGKDILKRPEDRVKEWRN